MVVDKVELLAPAGNYDAFLGALNAGADAVYLGGGRFGARAYADNFDDDQIVRTLHVAHFYGKKVYLTVNTLLKEQELAELTAFLTPFYEAGLDGVIVQDFGVFSHIRREFPALPLHVSTQMTVTGKRGAAFLKEQGACRIVPARELSLRGGRGGSGMLHPWRHVLLLFGTVPFQQYSRRQKRKQRTVRPALPSPLYDL